MNKPLLASSFVVLTVFAFQFLHAAESPAIKPVHLDCNTKADEDDPHVSSNGLMLYYSTKAQDLWAVMSSKRLPSGKWAAGKPVEGYIGPLPDAKKPADYRGVFVTTEKVFPQFMYFASNKNENDQKGDNFDLFVTLRNSAKDEFAPPEMVTVDSPVDELNPWLAKEGKILTLYFSRKTKDGYRVFAASTKNLKGGGTFEEPVMVDELPPDFHHVTLTADGQTMYLQGPLDNGRCGLFVSKKAAGKWGQPTPLDGLNNASGPRGDCSPCLSQDGLTLYFASDRAGGKGGLDLYSVYVVDLKKK